MFRDGPGQWRPDCSPAHLREACEGSLRRLGAERIDLYQLHTVDSKSPTRSRSALATGELAREGTVLDEVATRAGAAPSQVALAWLLRRSPAMLPIPGTGSVEHVEENLAAAQVQLGGEDVQQLDAAV